MTKIKIKKWRKTRFFVHFKIIFLTATQGINFKQNIWPVLRRPVSFHKFDNSQLSLVRFHKTGYELLF
jgi:hypothetical protein